MLDGGKIGVVELEYSQKSPRFLPILTSMTIHVDAVVQDGMLLPKQPVALPNGTQVTIDIATREPPIDPLAKVLGIGEGPPLGDAADHHDDYLYETK
jgi:predicted DNA-binding antitoxin AbrB/MazE fold protein